MKLAGILLVSFFINMLAFGQGTFTAPRFTKTAIGNSGSFAYLPETKTPQTFDMSYSPDSARLYTCDIAFGNFNYSVIVVKLNDVILETNEDKENMIISYLDYLKKNFDIVQFAGYGKGHTLESNPQAIGMIDYWEDKDKQQWSVKAWADESTLGVMLVYGATEYPNATTLGMFLNGFRFK